MIDIKTLTGRFIRYGPGKLLPDKTYVILDYKRVFGEKPDLKNPKTYSEKIQWLKLYDRLPIYRMLSDKLAAREYISDKFGEEYLFPLLGVFDSYDEIDFDRLPDRFVLKPNHSSGDIFFCENKGEIDHKVLKKTLRRWMRRDYYYEHREWQYKGIKRKILCEAYMEDETHGTPLNYKFFSFNGEPRVLMVTSGLGGHRPHSFFDLDLSPVPVQEGRRVINCIERTDGYDKMLGMVRELVKPFIHVRMDMYLISGKVYIGEFTFHNDSGLVKWEPEQYDLELGEMMKLPGKG